ncbi:hypothetical protein, partial [Flavobacterium laiguense]
GGQFTPKLVVNLHWNGVVNLTGFSTLIKTSKNALMSAVEHNEKNIVDVCIEVKNVLDLTAKLLPISEMEFLDKLTNRYY